MIPKSLPGLDPGWIPVFGKDHAPPNASHLRKIAAKSCLRGISSSGSTAAARPADNVAREDARAARFV
jgi:hypothetical protein